MYVNSIQQLLILSLLSAQLFPVPLGNFEQDSLGLLFLVVLGEPPHRLIREEPGQFFSAVVRFNDNTFYIA